MKTMERTLLVAFIMICCTPIYAQSSLGSDTTQKTYKYKVYDMDLDLLIKNLEMNLQGYASRQRWSESKEQAFYNAYYKYLSALKEGRLSTSSTGNIVDSEGKLGNGSPIWYDKKGNAYSQEQYDKLKKKQKKSCIAFYPNREVATYFDKVTTSIYEHTRDDKK